MRRIDNIVIHATGALATQSTESIKSYWLHKLGWKNAGGYHYLISADGFVEYLTDISKPTNGVVGFNAHSIHICYKGGLNGKDTRTPQQKESLLRIIKEMKAKFPGAKLMGHRDFSKDLDGDGVIEPQEWVKLCPCFSVSTEYKDLL